MLTSVLSRQRLDLASLQQSHEFQVLNHNVQLLILSLSQGPKDFEELRTLTRSENEHTRKHINNAFQQHEEQLEKKGYRERLLDSLWFDEIHSREENIVDAHRETFEWVFDKSDQAVRPWDNFIQWLENGQRTYWINGKAGSGKSTLMTFLCQDDRTIDSLRTWSGKRDRDVLMPKFFFWSGGKQMEKSIEGLLRSLVWQILQELPDLEIGVIGLHSGNMIAAWTERRLQKTLRSITQEVLNSYRLCFFIDGLDEYDGDQEELISFIQDTVQSYDVKVCVSSRPHPAFDRAFGSSAKLRLQDLTRNDIRKYVVDKVQGIPLVPSIAIPHPHWLDHITAEIVRRADGVFLWVSLAVKDQIRGLRNDDSPRQLEERLKSLPNEVEGIYARMLSQIEKTHRREASTYLRVAQYPNLGSLLDFILVSRDGLDDTLRSPDKMPELELVAVSHSVRKRIVTTCAGLLEVHDKNDSESEDDDKNEVESPELYSHSESEDDDKSEMESRESYSDSESKDDDKNEVESQELYSDSKSKDDDKSEMESRKSHSGSERDGSFVVEDRKVKSVFQGEATNDETSALERKVSVEFIHRTAVDFMRDREQGGAFLEANTPPNFDPQAFCVKVSLAKTRLFGLGEGLWMVDNPMSEISDIERRTGVAQTELCELVDDVMCRMDQASRNRHPESHWCARLLPHLQESLPDTEASSRSSTNELVYSTSSPTETQDGSTMVPTTEPTFLTWAAFCGVSLYVQQVLDCRKVPLERREADYLLYCSVRSILSLPHKVQRRFASLNLIDDILRRGGNPNVMHTRHTTWGLFLSRMSVSLLYGISIGYSSFEPAELKKAFMRTTAAFVENGADLLSTHSIGLRSDIIQDRFYNFQVQVQVSPLAMIEMFLSDQPEVSHVRDMCVAKGARYYLRGTKIKSKNRIVLDSEIEPSKEKSAAFLALFEKDLTSYSGYEHFQRQASNLVELYRDRLESSSSLSSE